ncbi:hypothetical protein PanWU01x14_297950 [Parasponia andersonii]|uniref:Uncharacterized protein n=1 Tax=Parasponia andersonii TaxID=3476 RepID=A0A2P5AUY5_PARAD|nr:hypothetical protein PanWU01x14_297950 [Parasponia andersonii]
METIHNFQIKSLYVSLEGMTRMVAMTYAQVRNLDESYRKEPSTSRTTLGLFDDKYLSKEENLEWINKERSQDNTCESSPFEIQIILLPSFIKDHIYDDPIWPKSTLSPQKLSFKLTKYLNQD